MLNCAHDHLFAKAVKVRPITFLSRGVPNLQGGHHLGLGFTGESQQGTGIAYRGNCSGFGA